MGKLNFGPSDQGFAYLGTHLDNHGGHVFDGHFEGLAKLLVCSPGQSVSRKQWHLQILLIRKEMEVRDRIKDGDALVDIPRSVQTHHVWMLA